jgi:integrase/recombinase XerD
MKASANINLDTRRKKKDETYPLVLRLVCNLDSRTIPLEYSVIKDDWDPDLEMVRKTCKKYSNVTRINNYLHKKQQDAQDILDKLTTTGEIEKLTITEMKNIVMDKKEHTSFTSFGNKLVDELKLAKKLGNASVYEQAISFLKRHANDKDLSFDEITFTLLKSIEAKFLSENNSLNGLSFYLRTIRAIYNRAIKEGIASREKYPFTTYSIKETKTRKRAIRKTDMDKIKDAQFEPGSPRWHTRNIFLFSFYNRGMNFADIAKLRMSDIEQDRIYYNRSKTGKPLSVKLTEATRSILSTYMAGKTEDDLVFPILKRDTPELRMKDLYNERKTFNNYLKKIAKALEIEGNLTSYVARHSWATIAKDLNIPISVISEGLGHEDIKTTQIYLDDFDTSVIDDANKLITG